jgi:23S rRNA (uracil1939-C5)-methyltransferase
MSRETVTIETIGAKGDGIAHVTGEMVYVPFTAPGDIATIDRRAERGRMAHLDRPSEHRIDPPCPHFGPDRDGCGGCQLQHIEPDYYTAWKRQLVVDALQKRGLEAEVEPLVRCQPRSRRRIVLSARRSNKAMTLGFNRVGSHDVVPVTGCTVMTEGLERALPVLERIAASLPGKSLRLTVLETQTGLDISSSDGPALNARQRLKAIETALSCDIARLSHNGELLIESRPPVIQFGTVAVTPPPGGFVQAVQEAETAMAECVAGHLGGLKRVADLFSGCGTFAARLAGSSSVTAAESDAPSLSALERAVRHAQGLKPVKTERRDLLRRPLTTNELKPFDGVVFDPPRAGAQAQASELARSGVRKIAAVSCNPATLARDLRLLVDGGYRLVSVLPVDQFLWSAHVEAVALLERS